MPLILLPNTEKLVALFLQTDADMITLVAGRVYSSLPANAVFPLVRVTQFDDAKVTVRPLWVARSSLQIEAWGGSNFEAWRIANTAQSVLAERLEGIHTDGIVVGVEIGSMRNAPDTAYNPPKPRRLFTAAVTVHPV